MVDLSWKIVSLVAVIYGVIVSLLVYYQVYDTNNYLELTKWEKYRRSFRLGFAIMAITSIYAVVLYLLAKKFSHLIKEVDKEYFSTATDKIDDVLAATPKPKQRKEDKNEEKRERRSERNERNERKNEERSERSERKNEERKSKRREREISISSTEE